jgi:hypothetical protein
LEDIFKHYFIKNYLLFFKGFIFKSQITLCKQNLWPQIQNSIKNLVLMLKTCFPTDLKPCSDFCKISESGLNCFGAFFAKSVKELRKEKRKRSKEEKNMKTDPGEPFDPTPEASHGPASPRPELVPSALSPLAAMWALRVISLLPQSSPSLSPFLETVAGVTPR